MTFEGHVGPGFFFGVFGVWWSLITAIRYVQSQIKSQQKKDAFQHAYTSSAWMPCVCLPCVRLRHMPIESFMKIFFCCSGIFAEIVTGFHYRLVQKHRIIAPPPNMNHHKRDVLDTLLTTK